MNIDLLIAFSIFFIGRRDMGYFGGCVETSAILCKVKLRKEVRDHPFFCQMWDAAGDCLTFQNDILSLKKEVENGDPLNNLVRVKITQGATAKEAFKETLRIIWDSTYQFIYFAELLLEEFRDDKDLDLYIQMIINMINGDPTVHSRMKRYTTVSCEIVRIQEFDTIDEQFEYAYNFLLNHEQI